MGKRRGHGEGTVTYWEAKKLWVGPGDNPEKDQRHEQRRGRQRTIELHSAGGFVSTEWSFLCHAFLLAGLRQERAEAAGHSSPLLFELGTGRLARIDPRQGADRASSGLAS